MNEKLIAALFAVAFLCIAGLAAFVLTAAPAQTEKGVYGDYWSGDQTTLNTSMWRDMTNNVTNIRDSMIPNNVTMVISAATTNLTAYKTALRSNGTIVMNNGTIAPLLNLTTSYAQLTVTGAQSLNFTMPLAGSYLINADIRENVSISTPTAGINSTYALCDAGNANVVTNTERLGTMLVGTTPVGNTRHFTWIYTNATAAQVGVCGKVSTSVDGEWLVVSDSMGRSTLNYAKLA